MSHEVELRSCSTCNRGLQPIEDFMNVKTGRITKTCIDCRLRKRKYNDSHDIPRYIEDRLKSHYETIKSSVEKCVDCNIEFEQSVFKKVMFYRKDHQIKIKLYRFRSPEKMTKELINYDVLCPHCFSIRKDKYCY